MNAPLSPALDDETFDRHLPYFVRCRSRQYWTPVAVIERAVAEFSRWGARHILDVGCGPGKFCVGAAYLGPELQLHGVEQRPRLVTVGRRLANQLGVSNVSFSRGDATLTRWDRFGGFYFFNPFAESTFDEEDRFDDEVCFSAARFSAELLRTEQLLARAPVGTVVVTYHGIGGPIPASYELTSDQPAGSDRLRTWVQRTSKQSRWAWLEASDGVVQVTRSEVHEALESVVGAEART